ncbi:CBS domain-containing protein [Nocardioides pyridinolyticus]
MQDLWGKVVHDVVVRLPKTLSRATSVAEARAAFDDDHVHMLLLVDDDARLLGTLVRDDLPDAEDETPPAAMEHSVLRDRTVPPGVPAEAALQLLLSRGERRRAVIDQDGRLLGLLCLKRRLDGFCGDADVLARATSAGCAPRGT